MSPAARVVLLGCASLAAVCVDHLGPLLLLCLLCAAPLFTIRPEGRRIVQGLALIGLIVWSTALSQALFYPLSPRVPLLRLGPLTLWREGAIDGLHQALRFVALSLGGLSLTATTPTHALAQALQRLGAPPALAFLASAALRFVPTVTAELLAVRAARASRGRPLHQRSPLAWLKLELALLRPVISRSLRRATALAESLEARGFDPAALPPAAPAAPAPGDWILLPALLFTAALVAARLLYLLYTADLLYLPALRPLYALVRGSL